MKINKIMQGKGQSNQANFAGEVYRQVVVGANETGDVEILAVFFNAGARTRAHTHPQDQILYIRDGRGVVATETETRVVEPGDVVTIPAGTWHWHGATPASAMCHLSVMKPGTTNWEVEIKNWESGYEGVE